MATMILDENDKKELEQKIEDAAKSAGTDGGHYIPSVVDNGDGTMTISFTASKEGMEAVNPVTITLPVPADGKDGQDGQDGENGKDGENGGYYTPTVETVTENSFKISFSPSKSGMPAVGDVTITLPAAKDGEDGKDGTNGTNGQDGVGIESVVQTTTSTADGGENVITVTLTNGNKSTFKVKNGSKGRTGDTGETGATGADGKDGYTPVKGVDYYTPEDKAEIIQEILAELGAAVIGYVDGDTITVKGNLADGTYTAYYEVDGELIEIGELTLTEGGETPEPVTYTVTFVTDGVTVETVTYKAGATSIEEPAVPAKDGYTGAWETYDITNGGNITVNAVYTEITVTPTYTNLLTEAGYETGKKVSTSSGSLSDADACASGFIAVPSGAKTVRIKNIAFSQTANINNIVFYNAEKVKINFWLGSAGGFNSAVTVSDGVYSFSPGDSAVRYFRFSCAVISDDSIVTIDQEIV